LVDCQQLPGRLAIGDVCATVKAVAGRVCLFADRFL